MEVTSRLAISSCCLLVDLDGAVRHSRPSADMYRA